MDIIGNSLTSGSGSNDLILQHDLVALDAFDMSQYLRLYTWESSLKKMN